MIKAVLIIGLIAISIIAISGEIENRQNKKNKIWWEGQTV